MARSTWEGSKDPEVHAEPLEAHIPFISSIISRDSPSTKRKLKFTFKEQREFETIDADLAELEAQITACQTEQESCGSDYVKLQELQARQAELEAALEEKTERWVYLNELKEQIDAQNG